MTPHGVATVARQEFRLRIRAGRWKWLLGIWFAVLLLFTGLLRGALGGFSRQRVEDKGVVIYGGLMLFVLGLALLVVPALAAQSVNGDRERGTLATLQVTRLSAGDICLGKFAAAWGTSLVFLALTIPLIGYAVTQGGVRIGRVLVVTVVLALLLGTVCAIALALSALLARTTTSAVLAYLAVFGLTIGTAITFGLATAITTEKYTATYTDACPAPSSLPSDLPQSQRDTILASCGKTQTYQETRSRTDRTWWLLAPNPFVILADAAPQLPPLTAAQRRQRQADEQRGIFRQDARNIDPLGGLGRAVRSLRKPPTPTVRSVGSYSQETLTTQRPTREQRRPVWPWGLAADVLLAGLSLWVTARRLATPSRTLPKGQRVA